MPGARVVLVVGPDAPAAAPPDGATLVRGSAGLRADYGARRPLALVVRPDGHIAAALDGDRAGELHAVLRRCAGEGLGEDGEHPRPRTAGAPRRRLRALNIQPSEKTT